MIKDSKDQKIASYSQNKSRAATAKSITIEQKRDQSDHNQWRRMEDEDGAESDPGHGGETRRIWGTSRQAAAANQWTRSCRRRTRTRSDGDELDLTSNEPDQTNQSKYKPYWTHTRSKKNANRDGDGSNEQDLNSPETRTKEGDKPDRNHGRRSKTSKRRTTPKMWRSDDEAEPKRGTGTSGGGRRKRELEDERRRWLSLLEIVVVARKGNWSWMWNREREKKVFRQRKGEKVRENMRKSCSAKRAQCSGREGLTVDAMALIPCWETWWSKEKRELREIKNCVLM